MVEIRGPLMVERRFAPEMKLELFLKDFKLMLEEGQHLGVPLPLTSLTHQLCTPALGACRALRPVLLLPGPAGPRPPRHHPPRAGAGGVERGARLRRGVGPDLDQRRAARISALPRGQPSAAPMSRSAKRCISSPSIESTASAATTTRKSRFVASKLAQSTQVEVLIPARISVSAPRRRRSVNSRSVAWNGL